MERFIGLFSNRVTQAVIMIVAIMDNVIVVLVLFYFSL